MKNIIFIILIFPFVGIAQQIYVPDDNFEQELINLGLDDVLNDSVYTSAIDTVEYLFIPGMGISDLTGIEDFSSLTELFCYNNQIVSLDLSSNDNLFEVNCNNNQLISLSVKNGNSSGLWYFTAVDNPSLLCVEVDNVSFANYTWQIDNTAVFSTNCTISSLVESQSTRKITKIIDVNGREVIDVHYNSLYFYIYSDGSIEKINYLK